MNKTIWTLVIIVVVLVVLYLVYKYMFAPKQKTDTVFINSNSVPVPVVKPTPSGIINEDFTSDISVKLMKMINCLGYQVQPIKSDGAVMAYTTNKTLDAFVKQFPKVEVIANVDNVLVSNIVSITSNGVPYKLDKEKYLKYHELGLHTITYSNKNETQIKSLIDKMNLFWGTNYFDSCLGFSNPVATSTERLVVDAIKNSKPVVDCNSSEYLEKLQRLNANAQGFGADYQIAVYNLNNVDNAENNQAHKRASDRLKEGTRLLNEHIALCKTS